MSPASCYRHTSYTVFMKGVEGERMEGGQEEEGIRSCTKVCVGGGLTDETKSERGRSVNENLRPKSGNKITTGTNRRSGLGGGTKRGMSYYPEGENIDVVGFLQFLDFSTLS